MKNIGAKDVGLMMLGAGVLLFALIALHFYVTEVVPHIGSNEGRFGAYCQRYEKDTALITINNYGSERIVEANVYVDDRLACQLKDIPTSSSDICKVPVEENTVAVFRVVALTSSGKKLKDAGTCPGYEIAVPRSVPFD